MAPSKTRNCPAFHYTGAAGKQKDHKISSSAFLPWPMCSKHQPSWGASYEIIDTITLLKRHTHTPHCSPSECAPAVPRLTLPWACVWPTEQRLIHQTLLFPASPSLAVEQLQSCCKHCRDLPQEIPHTGFEDLTHRFMPNTDGWNLPSQLKPGPVFEVL